MAVPDEGDVGDKGPAPSGRAFLRGIVPILAFLALGFVLLMCLLPLTRGGAKEAARRTQCRSNLKQIGLALHNYQLNYGCLPPAFTVDAEGRPLHSWRTLILPFLEQEALYQTIDLSRPWDDPANREARETRLLVYLCPSSPEEPGPSTPYLGIVAPGGCFDSRDGRRLDEFTDSTSNTLMVIEVPDADAVPWMSPCDADLARVLRFGLGIKERHTGGFHGLFADGAVRYLKSTLSPATRQALITVAGGESISPDSY